MPLPANSTPWPPEDAATRRRMLDYDAWYSGDPERLGSAYLGRAEKSGKARPSERTGGFIQTIARWFWGTPTSKGESRRKLHVPLAADIATASSDLLFAKPPAVRWKQKATQDRWDLLDDQIKLRSRLHEAAEVQSPLGGVYLRAHWDRTVAGHPLLSAVHADRAVPEFRGDRLVAVTFWQTLREDATKVVRHLQRYEMRPTAIGAVAVEENAVYVGREDNLGSLGNLDDYDETRGTPPTIAIGLPVLPVVHIPNMLPSREDRGSLVGRSDYEGVTQLFDAIDEVMTSWMRDVRLAKARIIVPSAYLNSLGPGQGAQFDADREVYEGLEMAPTQTSGNAITLQQFAIRVDEHDRSMMRLVRLAVGTAGYSAATFGLEEQGGGGEQTATEVNDRRNRSLLTRDKKAAYWTAGLQQIAQALLYIDRIVFNTGVNATEVPAIDWPDGVATDQLKLAQTVREWDVARAASIETKVRAIHPDWDDIAVTAEVKRIQEENGSGPVEDPGTFTGGQQPPAADQQQDEEPV